MRPTMKLFACAIAALLGLTVPAHAGKSDDTLRVTLRDAIPNVDPYYNAQAAGLILATHVWDTLLIRDPETGEPKPGLAVAWKVLDERTTEFKLRDGVKFHNGDAFSADDVVYTLNTIIKDKKVATPSNFIWIDRAEKIDPLTVRVYARQAFPAAIEFLTSIAPIWPKAYRERVGEDEYARKPVGTGPYRIVSLDSSEGIKLERFDGYFSGSPKGKPAIRTIIFRAVAEMMTQMAELIGGRTDWIEDVNADQYDSLSRLPNVQTARREIQRVAYINIAGAGRDRPDSPLKNVLVRRALFHAIDRQTMAKQFMPGGSRVLNVICYDGQFGCDQSKTVSYEYDPAKAKKLLTEAGYPNGFDTELYSYLDPNWGGAVQNYLGAVGVKVKLQQQAVAAVIKAAQEGRTPLALAGWGGFGINEVSPYLQYFFMGDLFDQARDAEIKALVETGGSTIDAEKRLAVYGEAFRLISERAHFMPLFTYVKTYAMSKDLNFKPYYDGWPRFYLASWK